MAMIETASCNQTGLPLGENPAPLETPHFPTRWQAVLWRNWSVVTPERLAQVLGATPDQIEHEGRRMGLDRPASPAMQQRWLRRGYITLIRQNWHLLPYPQLLQLLDWEPQQMAFALKEDDFLWQKLGRLKPNAMPVRYEPLTPKEQERTERLREVVANAFPDVHLSPVEQPFDFLEAYAAPPPVVRPVRQQGPFGLKLAYSHGAVYGDPLLSPALDPYPEGLLARLAENGINAVWLHAVLYTLVPWLGNVEASKGHEQRTANLHALTAKAAKYGISVYLYLNEPRGMPPAFFENRLNWRGVYYPATHLCALCTSNPEILDRLRTGVRTLFERVPGLAGILTITMSENLTHCRSKRSDKMTPCLRCRQRPVSDLVAEVNNAIAQGVHEAKPEADVIVWDWAWELDQCQEEHWSAEAIRALQPGVRLMCTSETFVPTHAMGVDGYVCDYSMSKVGPGPVAARHWRYAADRGLECLAKVQLNNTWECSAVPYLPVPFLVKRHLRNLEAAKVAGLMVSWTLGGYPGGNLALTYREPEDLAVEWFGQSAAPSILDAWQRFGQAFEHFPLHGTACLYNGPQNVGPMNLLYARPTGYRATMVGFPYDDLTTWRGGGHYGEEVFEAQFRKLSEGWGEALQRLKATADRIPPEKATHYDDLLNVSEAAWCHFRSTYLQIRFIRLRSMEQSHSGRADAIRQVLDEEISLAKMLLAVLRRDSRIGFEASNHYYYTEMALMEKVLNCEYNRSCV